MGVMWSRDILSSRCRTSCPYTCEMAKITIHLECRNLDATMFADRSKQMWALARGRTSSTAAVPRDEEREN